MIITIDVFLKLCAGISCVGLALSYLIKAINSVKKPVKDVNDKFKSYDEYFQMDKKRLDNFENCPPLRCGRSRLCIPSQKPEGNPAGCPLEFPEQKPLRRQLPPDQRPERRNMHRFSIPAPGLPSDFVSPAGLHEAHRPDSPGSPGG